MKTQKIACFEKVSLNQYIESRQKMFDTPENLTSGDVKSMMTQFEQEWHDIKLPTRATEGSAGYDFYMPFDLRITDKPVAFPTGICCDMDIGWVLLIMPRSGLGFKYGMRLNNSIGVIDADYYQADNEGHIHAKFYAADKPLELHTGDRFAQGIFLPYGTAVNGNLYTKRTGGFGSTGTK